MKDLVLDTSVVLRNPSALSKKLRNARLLIPDIVQREVEFIATKRRDAAELPNLIQESAAKGLLSIERTPAGFAGEHRTNTLTLADALIFQFVQYLQSEKRDFAFVTSDNDLLKLSAAAGIPTMGQTEFSLYLAESESRDEEIEAKAARIRRSQRLTTILSLIAGIIGSFSALFPPAWAHAVFASISIWGTLILLFGIGLGLYIFRARFRLVYGIFEFGFGFLLAGKIFWPKFDYTILSATDYLQVIASLYIMVRGLDNIHKAAKGTFLEPLFERLGPSS